MLMVRGLFKMVRIMFFVLGEMFWITKQIVKLLKEVYYFIGECWYMFSNTKIGRKFIESKAFLVCKAVFLGGVLYTTISIMWNLFVIVAV